MKSSHQSPGLSLYRPCGFTLLEVLLTITILSTLMVFTTKNIQQALRSKVKLQQQIEDMSSVRDALRIIESDINMAFHFRDIEVEFQEEVKKRSKPAASQTARPPGGGFPFPNFPGSQNPPMSAEEMRAKENRVPPETHFIGKEAEINFVTQNTGQLSESTIQADFIKVGYLLKSCRKPGSEKTSNCLMRRQSSIAEGDVLKGGKETLLMENVGEFKLRYIGGNKKDWTNEWSSVSGDSATKDNYPEAVEITLTLDKSKAEDVEKNPDAPKKIISMNLTAKVHFPNNKESSDSSNSSNPFLPDGPTSNPGGGGTSSGGGGVGGVGQ